jgi:hypothetical protein
MSGIKEPAVADKNQKVVDAAELPSHGALSRKD